jgi:hypothetical protein
MLGENGAQFVLLPLIPLVVPIFMALAAAVVGWLLLPSNILIMFAGVPDFGKTTVVHSDHPQLNRLCAEARSLLFTLLETSTPISERS